MLYVFYALITLSCILSVVFSFKSRRAGDPKHRGLYAARMNMSMGALLILAALVQLVLFEPDTIRIVVGAIFLLVGAFNIFAGVRNHIHFTKM